MRIICPYSNQYTPLGEGMGKAISIGLNWVQCFCITPDAEGNETRKNPEQAFERIFSQGLNFTGGTCHLLKKANETYCQRTRAGAIHVYYTISTFSNSHSSTSTYVENGPAYCFFITPDLYQQQFDNEICYWLRA